MDKWWNNHSITFPNNPGPGSSEVRRCRVRNATISKRRSSRSGLKGDENSGRTENQGGLLRKIASSLSKSREGARGSSVIVKTFKKVKEEGTIPLTD